MASKIKKYIDKYGVAGCALKVVFKFLYPSIQYVYTWYIRWFVPIDEKKVLFMSKPAFSDNSLALFEYYLENKPNYKYVWMLKKTDEIPPNIKYEGVIIYNRGKWSNKLPLKSIREILTSKYLYFTHGSPFHGCAKRNGQTVINLWHGCGYKDREKTKKSYLQENPFDYALVPGEVFVDKKAQFWGCGSEQIVTLGYPRYDLFFKECAGAKEYIESLKKEAKKIIVWMPTLRNAVDNDYPENKIQRKFDLPILESVDQVINLNDYCKKKKIHLCVKRHPAQKKYFCENMYFSNITFISNENLNNVGIALYDMLHYTDALISDYSSVAIDYMLLDRPMAFCLDDFKEYENARGFVFDNPIDYMAGHHLYNYEDLLAFLEAVSSDVDRYIYERKKLMPEVHNVCDNYCERIIKFVENNS